MKIDHYRSWREEVPLTKAYRIAGRRIADVSLFFVEIRCDRGVSGFGCGSPAQQVTGESSEACEQALAAEWLVGRDPRHLGELTADLRRRMSGSTPAARAAIDMALHDLFAKLLGIPLVDLFGRSHTRLPTSITVGIQPIDSALAEVEGYLKAGFRCLKIKIGEDIESDLECLIAIRQRCGDSVAIRVDANRGYSLDEARRLLRVGRQLDIELIEQPLDRPLFSSLSHLSDAERAQIAADESLIGVDDAWNLLRPPTPCGIFNIKLMKCGGISDARRIASLADHAEVKLMWGCMDESRLSIAAALHTALASPATRYLDLDGSFDLANDPFLGGFRLIEGYLETAPGSGLGIEPR